jgi:hypothetical protein
MALSSDQLNEAMAVANRLIRDEIPNQFSKASYFMHLMTKKPNLEYGSGGTKIQIPVQIAENSSKGWFDGGFGAIDTNANQQISFGEFDWKYYYSNVSFTVSDFAQTDNTPLAIKSLITAKIEGAKQAANRDISSSLHGDGSATGSVTGLGAVFAASGTAYAGITNTDLDDSSTWLTEIDTTTNTINYANLNTLFMTLVGRGQTQGNEIGGFQPDLLISNAFVLNKFLGSQQSQQQFATESSLKAGFRGATFNGTFWAIDSFSPGSADGATADNYLYVMASPTFKLIYKYGFEGRSAAAFDQSQMRLPSQAVVANQNYMVFNLACTARRYNGVFKALTS